MNFESLLKKNLYNPLKNYLTFNDIDQPIPLFKPKNIEISTDDKKNILKLSDEIFNDMGRRIIYVVSPSQRSGTNFLHKLLSYSHEVCIPEHPFFPSEQFIFSYSPKIWEYCQSTFGLWSKWSDHNWHYHIAQMLKGIGDSYINLLVNLNKNSSDKAFLLRSPDSYHFEDLLLMLKNIRIIYLYRDGRDTVNSFVKSWGSGNFKQITSRWAHRIRHAQEVMGTRFDQHDKRILPIKYEDLVLNTPEELDKIFAFCNLKLNEEIISKALNAPVLGSSEFKGHSENVHWEPLKKNEHFKPIGKWRNWKKSQKSTFKNICKDILIDLEYEQNNEW